MELINLTERERFCVAGHLYRPRFLKTNPAWISVWQQCHCPLLTLVYVVASSKLRKRSCHIFSDRMNWIWLKCMNIRIFCDKLPLHLGCFHCNIHGCDGCWETKLLQRRYCWWLKMPLTSWGWYFIPLFTGFYTSQVVVCDFWTISSSTQRKFSQWRGGTNAGTGLRGKGGKCQPKVVFVCF